MQSSRVLVRRTALTALAVATALSLSACSINIGWPGQSNMGGMMMQQGSGAYSSTDLMFAAMMIPHHQQAVEMSDLALNISKNADVRALASQIKAAQQPEIDQMSSWLAGTSQEAMSKMMSGMDHDMMGGMLDDAQMTALKAAVGLEFDRLFLQGMILHHQGALAMTQMIKNSSNEEVRTLANNIVTSQTAEIARMTTLLKTLG